MDSLSLWREMGDKQGLSTSLNNLGYLNFLEGDSHGARAWFVESLVLSSKMGIKANMIWALIGLAGSLNAALEGDGEPVPCANLAGRRRAVRAGGGSSPVVGRGVYEKVVATEDCAGDEGVVWRGGGSRLSG